MTYPTTNTPDITGSNKTIVYAKKGRLTVLAIISAIFVLMGILFIYTAFTNFNNGDSLAILIIGIICLVFFGFCGIFTARMVFGDSTYVVLTEQGLYDYSSAVATREMVIPWSEIAQVGALTQRTGFVSTPYVSIFLRSPQLLESKNASPFGRWYRQANRKLGFGEINIPVQNAKDYDLTTLTDLVHGYWMRYNSNPQQPNSVGDFSY